MLLRRAYKPTELVRDNLGPAIATPLEVGPSAGRSGIRSGAVSTRTNDGHILFLFYLF
jgi:hypothetical protein